MTAERTNDPAPKRQPCPSCTQPMRLVRRTPRFGGLPELMTFECESCGLSHIVEDARPRKVSPQTDISAWYLDEFGNPTREIKLRE
jgi:C4-type Zn-finger protein